MHLLDWCLKYALILKINPARMMVNVKILLINCNLWLLLMTYQITLPDACHKDLRRKQKKNECTNNGGNLQPIPSNINMKNNIFNNDHHCLLHWAKMSISHANRMPYKLFFVCPRAMVYGRNRYINIVSRDIMVLGLLFIIIYM